jgi:hypothetical protein
MDLAALGLKKASPRGALIQIKIQQMPARRFPPPWTVEEQRRAKAGVCLF